MEITSLRCNNCGANLEINPNIKFFTCTFCKSSLTIKKSGNVMFTEVLEEIKKDTEALIDNSEEMLIEKKIARLDREWKAEREQFRINGNDGIVYYPNESSSSLVSNIFLLIGWLIFIFIISSVKNGGGLTILLFILGTFVFIVMGFSFHFDGKNKERFLTAKKEYEEERKFLLSQMEK